MSPKKDIAYQALLCASLWVILGAFVVELNDYGGVYSFFLIRFITSMLTMQQLLVTTQSSSILFESFLPGVCRLISSGCATISFLKIFDHSIFFATLGVACMVWDTIYTLLASYRYYLSTKEKKE